MTKHERPPFKCEPLNCWMDPAECAHRRGLAEAKHRKMTEKNCGPLNRYITCLKCKQYAGVKRSVKHDATKAGREAFRGGKNAN